MFNNKFAWIVLGIVIGVILVWAWKQFMVARPVAAATNSTPVVTGGVVTGGVVGPGSPILASSRIASRSNGSAVVGQTVTN